MYTRLPQATIEFFALSGLRWKTPPLRVDGPFRARGFWRNGYERVGARDDAESGFFGDDDILCGNGSGDDGTYKNQGYPRRFGSHDDGERVLKSIR